jgi:hypothetical protein
MPTELESVSPGLALEIEAAIAEVGQPVVLRRIGTPNVDLPLAARILAYLPQEIGAGVVQGDRQAIIGNISILEAAWPGPPRRGDQLLYSGKTTTIMGCDTQVVGTETVRHNLQVRGS